RECAAPVRRTCPPPRRLRPLLGQMQARGQDRRLLHIEYARGSPYWLRLDDSWLLPGTLGRAIVGRTRKHTFAARQLYPPGIARIGSVLGAETFNGGLIAYFERVSAPAIARQGIGRPTLALPVSYGAAFVLGVQINPDMGIHPVQFRNRTLQVDGFVGIKLGREGMMGRE